MPPDGIVQRTGGLVRGSETQQVEAVHLPTQGGQAWSGAAPMAAGGPEAMQQQQAILNMVQQNMMSGALSAAMANPGMMESMGSGIGSIFRGALGLPSPTPSAGAI